VSVEIYPMWGEKEEKIENDTKQNQKKGRCKEAADCLVGG